MSIVLTLPTQDDLHRIRIYEGKCRKLEHDIANQSIPLCSSEFRIAAVHTVYPMAVYTWLLVMITWLCAFSSNMSAHLLPRWKMVSKFSGDGHSCCCCSGLCKWLNARITMLGYPRKAVLRKSLDGLKMLDENAPGLIIGLKGLYLE
ncbi:hypothetical protein L2E82_35594 [Cichorium intybus]|uniref:Uncharacterized protein n=1 Tax=Cichorium intybus TaxID=13427 RepID=A0ACB9BPH1_CICIN|nr:hypothetical protein L2E82_35594 [Cichorium intybus]